MNREKPDFRTAAPPVVRPHPLDLGTRGGKIRAVAHVALVAFAVFLIALGSQVKFRGSLPAPLAGATLLVVAACGIYGLNIWRGGPFDPRREWPPDAPSSPTTEGTALPLSPITQPSSATDDDRPYVDYRIIQVSRHGPVTVALFPLAKLTGPEVDAVLREELRRLAGEVTDTVVLDVRPVEFIDHKFIGRFVMFWKTTRERGVRMLVCASPAVREVIHVIKLDRVWEIVNDYDPEHLAERR